jgi:hypothetical protein
LSYRLECDYRESQIEKQVSRYLGVISTIMGERFHLIDADESRTGADAMLDWKAITFYFQFKRPTGLASVTTVSLPLSPPGKSKTQAIRRFRYHHGLTEHPHSLCFQLRKQAKTATELQHNLLWKQHHTGPGIYATYVCSLQLKLQEYLDATSGGINLCPPSSLVCWREVSIVDQSTLLEMLAYIMDDVPAFRAHIAFPPHASVRTHQHHYSFSPQATDIAFHSEPQIIHREEHRLSGFLARSLIRAAQSYQTLPTLRRLASILEIRPSLRSVVADESTPPDNAITRLRSYGQQLYREHGIRQYVFAFRPNEKVSRANQR